MFKSDTVSKLPCARCGGEVVEFSVPNDCWNAVVRHNNHEADSEYLCAWCFLDDFVQWFARDAQLRIGADDAGQKSPMCNPKQHDWKEVYYGYKCERCQMFVPFGGVPWAPIDE